MATMFMPTLLIITL